MTLLRQLILVIVTLFLLLFAGTFVISVHNTQAYLSSQLQTISQDTATSLGLTLSPHFADDEMIVVESMTSAVFDSGYYREVLIKGTDGKIIIEHVAPVSIEGVPSWFIQLVPLETPRGEALIMAGWKQAGTISVSANPGEAYITLWSNAIQSFWWFLISSILTFLLGVVALHYVLRPLHAVEQQAKAICDREYPVQDKLPWTLELRSVVEAMNRMTLKVRDMFQEQADAMERMQLENFRDAVTGLANRKYFDTQLRHLIASKEVFHTGALILIEVRDLKHLNEQYGYVRTDAILRDVGALIREHCDRLTCTDHFASHIAGADFAIVLGDVSEKEVEEFIDQLMSSLPRLLDNGLLESLDIAHAGIAIYQDQTYFDLLSDADTALRAAQMMGANRWHIHGTTGEKTPARGATDWSSALQEIIRERRIALFIQPIVRTGSSDVVEHREALLRVVDPEGNIIPAGTFIPMAKRLGMIQSFDRLIIDEVIARLNASTDPTPIAVNLFPACIQDEVFIDWLIQTLHANPDAASRMIFEIAEYGAVENLSCLKHWVDRMRQTGAKTGIDHFGKALTSFGYLCDTRIDYLKIDGSFINDLGHNKDHRFFIESIIKIAHGLDITVVAESVENPDEIALLTAMGVDAMQGYGLAAPAPWV